MGFSPARFRKLRTSATLEFQRLLIAGESAILLLPSQHRSTVREILAGHGLTEADDALIYCDLSVNLAHGLWAPRADWAGDKKIADLPQDAISALALSKLLTYVESGQYCAQPLEGRLVVRNQILLIWWDLFVIPELETLGHSRTNSRNRAHTNSRAGKVPVPTASVEAFARGLLNKGIPRDEAQERLIEQFGFGVSRANKVLAKVGYIAQRGRKKNTPTGKA